MCILFICKCNFFYGNVHWTLKWWDSHEGMKLLLKWKMKCFVAGMKENERNFILLFILLLHENSFHSFMVADQVFLRHLPVIHDVNGSYQSHTLLIPPILKANTQPPTFEYLGLLKYFFITIVTFWTINSSTIQRFDIRL